MNTKLRIALLLPLVGLLATWSMYLTAAYIDLPRTYESFDIQWTVYLYLGGIAVVALASSFAFTISDALHVVTPTGITRSVYRFNGLAVVLSMVAGAVFAIGTFLDSFNSTSTNFGANKLVEVYVPIILVTIVVVYVLLQATVFRKSEAEEGAPADPRKRALGLAWSLPIIGTALALIIGLIAYGSRSEVETWVWVLIQGVILTSLVLGTNFAVKARSTKRVAARERVVGAGAMNLNFVLSIIFSSVVGIMSFVYGLVAIDKLAIRDYTDKGETFELMPVTAGWLITDFIPALLLLLLAEAAVYLTVTLRNAKAE
jgi:hypothetical protein